MWKICQCLIVPVGVPPHVEDLSVFDCSRRCASHRQVWRVFGVIAGPWQKVSLGPDRQTLTFLLQWVAFVALQSVGQFNWTVLPSVPQQPSTSALETWRFHDFSLFPTPPGFFPSFFCAFFFFTASPGRRQKHAMQGYNYSYSRLRKREPLIALGSPPHRGVGRGGGLISASAVSHWDFKEDIWKEYIDERTWRQEIRPPSKKTPTDPTEVASYDKTWWLRSYSCPETPRGLLRTANIPYYCP